MEPNTQAHTKVLRRICTLGRVAGWAMIAMGILGVGSLVYAHLIAHIGIDIQRFLDEILVVAGHVLIGLLVLGTVQFIRYAAEDGTEPKWLLRKGHIILCFFALSVLLTEWLRTWPSWWRVVDMFLSHPTEQMIPMGRSIGIALVTLAYLLPILTKVLCVLGIAAILRAVLPIMAESKTLA